MADSRKALMYRLTAQEALEAVLDFALKHGMAVPKRVEGGTVAVENGVVVVTVVDADPQIQVTLSGASMIT
jgi:hypothetical protein